MREEGGVKALYRGLFATSAGAHLFPDPTHSAHRRLPTRVPFPCAGVAPYVAFNFASYELLKIQLIGRDPEHHQPGTIAKLICGAVAGAISQTVRINPSPASRVSDCTLSC